MMNERLGMNETEWEEKKKGSSKWEGLIGIERDKVRKRKWKGGEEVLHVCALEFIKHTF